jgi:hypothetical protein
MVKPATEKDPVESGAKGTKNRRRTRRYDSSETGDWRRIRIGSSRPDPRLATDGGDRAQAYEERAGTCRQDRCRAAKEVLAEGMRSRCIVRRRWDIVDCNFMRRWFEAQTLLGYIWLENSGVLEMATQIVMDHTGDTRHNFDAKDAKALSEAEERFRERLYSGGLERFW